MGERANYVVVEDGSWHLYYSHWGAVDIDLDLLAGPAVATRFAYAQRAMDTWLDDVWCEAAALIDHDRRLLLWFSIHLDYASRAAALAVLARTWPGWRIEWAYDGLAALVAHVGLSRSVVRRPMDPEPVEDADDWIETLVTVAHGGRVAGYALITAADDIAGHGPAVLTALSECTPISACPEMPTSGIHLDVTARTAGVWTVASLGGALERVAECWPGWQWTFWEDRYGEQLARADGITLPTPDMRAALVELVERIERHRHRDPAHRAEAFVTRLSEVDGSVTPSPYFFDHHRVVVTLEEETATLAAIHAVQRPVL